jgi:hypothetical protein
MFAAASRVGKDSQNYKLQITKLQMTQDGRLFGNAAGEGLKFYRRKTQAKAVGRAG